MKTIVRILLVAFALAWVAMPSEPASAQAPSLKNRKTDFAYFPPKTAKYTAIMDRLKRRKTLELLSEFVSPLRFPHPFYMVTMECGEANAFYYGSEWTIVMCYEFVEMLDKIAPKPGKTIDGFTNEEVVVGETVLTLLHELGHAAFDMLKIPVFGREEDAADQFGIFLAMQFSPQVARLLIRGDLFFWKNQGNPTDWRDFAGEHGTPGQRFYNEVCWAYGGFPEVFKDVVANGWLPAARAPFCKDEYQQIKAAFDKTVMPFIDKDLMKQVQSRDWLKLLLGK
jgi:hypothetical protein